MSFQDNLRKIFRKGDGMPRLAVSLSGTMVVALGLVLAACVAWAFFMGLMVGKGQHPQAGIQNMTGLALKDEEENREKVPPDVLEIDRPAVAAASEQAAPPHPFGRPDEREKGAWEETPEPAMAAVPDARGREAAKPKPRPAAPKKPVDDGKIYIFNYQAAAYRSEAEAVRLRDSLKKAGIKGNVQRSGKMHLVMVSMRGNETSALQLRSKLEGLKLGKPLLISKKPVEAKKGGKGKK